jgi:hypothetical protein
MSKSYNKHGSVCGGNDHTTMHHKIRAQQRMALREAILKYQDENYDFNLGTKPQEFWNIWDCPRDGMNTRHTLEDDRIDIWSDINKCLNGCSYWSHDGYRTRFIKDIKFYKKRGYVDGWYDFLESEEILNWLVVGKDPIKRLEIIPSEMVERYIKTRYKHWLRK